MYKLYYEVANLMFKQTVHDYYIVDTDLPIKSVLLKHIFTHGDAKEYNISLYKCSITDVNCNGVKDFSAVKTVDYDHLLKIYNRLKTLESTASGFYRSDEILSDLDLIFFNWGC